MHSKKDSLLKRWHSFRISPGACAAKWEGQYGRDSDGYRVVACKACPSFDPGKQVCSINFGSPVRKCVVSSIEAHLHDCKGKDVLEIGFGRFMLARNLIRRSGGTWTGVEPHKPRDRKPELGSGGYGHAADVPFPDNTFDMVIGVQSIEHWGQKTDAELRAPSDYKDCVAEVRRVLKPGGTVYFDAPVGLHGHEMFIMGDLEKIRSCFPADQWKNLQLEKWREDYEPLQPYPTPKGCYKDWSVEVTSYEPDEVAHKLKTGVVWMLAITAEKI